MFAGGDLARWANLGSPKHVPNGMSPRARTRVLIRPLRMAAAGLRFGLTACLLAFVFTVCPGSPAQTISSGLPATPPTNAAAVVAPIAAVSGGVASNRAQTADVSYDNGLLGVRANNASLNGILRDIARTTGMKLTGSVAEQRVFGNYGPAAPATILATLLNGTGSNMLLREAADAAPAELILTPRTGGPSPPSPPSYSADSDNMSSPPADMGNAPQNQPTSDLLRQRRQMGLNPAFGANGQNGLQNANQLPANQPSGMNGAPADTGFPTGVNANQNGIAVPGTNALPAGTGVNGDAKTPEQVYQLLQQLRQQSIQEQGGKQQ